MEGVSLLEHKTSTTWLLREPYAGCHKAVLLRGRLKAHGPTLSWQSIRNHLKKWVARLVTGTGATH